MEVLLEAEEEEEVAVQGEFRRETGGLVGVEEEVEAQNKVGQTLLNSSNPSAREDIVAVAKAGSTTATAKRRTSLASQKGEHCSLSNNHLGYMYLWSDQREQ